MGSSGPLSMRLTRSGASRGAGTSRVCTTLAPVRHESPASTAFRLRAAGLVRPAPPGPALAPAAQRLPHPAVRADAAADGGGHRDPVLRALRGPPAHAGGPGR